MLQMFDIFVYIGLMSLFFNVHFYHKHCLTVSELQSISIIHRNSLTFIFCLLGFSLMYKRIILYNSYIELIHLSLPLLSIFPLYNPYNQENREIVLFYKLTKEICNNIHYYIVFLYITIYPLYTLNYSVFFLSLFLYFCICNSYKYTIFVETYIMIIITLIFLHFK